MRVPLLFLCIATLLIFSCNEIKSSKNLYGFDKDTLSFGQLEQSDTLQRTIFCKSYSDSKIKVFKIESGCGCTKTVMLDSFINPLDSIPIFIKYIPSEVNDSGHIIKYITIRTNSTPAFKNLVITGEVIKRKK